MRNDYEDAAHLNGSSHDSAVYTGGQVEYDPYRGSEYGALKENQPRTTRSASVADSKRPATERTQSGDVAEHSKWIHRDKLAKIESEELQAAGIVLPRVRAPSRPRRDRSQDKASLQRRDTDNSLHSHTRPTSRKNSVQSDWTPEVEVPSWDLRLPDEIAEDANEQYWIQGGTGKSSKIPVAKLSPAPIPADFLDRDAPMSRKASHGTLLDDDQSFSLSKTRTASGSSHLMDDSPKGQSAKKQAGETSPKKAAQPRKSSGPAKPVAQSRPKTRSGSTSNEKGRSTSTTRPTTRSGEIRAPEGEPPWMVSAYKPDPRLPPDQQLLPTVAKRLQQEKWESEGKFGNVYDTDFRPLNEHELLKPPELQKPKVAPEEPEQNPEWPLRGEAKSPTIGSRPGTSSYSTMPKIQDKPQVSPMPSPRIGAPPIQPQPQPTAEQRPEPLEVAEEKKKKEAGCGCCIVM
ncbi:uncharacterized protein B0I36DRAFT_348024 [Microdochium trichocladiopsis]|uniref:TeaA receptor TeaR n=1 Tax=Microdochium trichocladiopsis TaxID=1682393 RepID=A0A9P8Y8X3_9PEZI|nr:uncharacterized protein B0I36DRAFT_348024 [Microdochium trichocladiopsis]KAH7032871.1 hypothetical protein B0I36DRAFT_348024 [Microdochium trichocladiopsis]